MGTIIKTRSDYSGRVFLMPLTHIVNKRNPQYPFDRVTYCAKTEKSKFLIYLHVINFLSFCEFTA